MSDLAPDSPDTPTPQDPNADTDWQKRYSDLQPEYTRTTQALKDEQAVWDNEQAVLARIAEKYPHLMADEDTDEPEDDDVSFEDDDPRFQKLTELEKKAQVHDEWIAEQSQKDASAQFNKDLTDEAGDRALSRQAKEWIFNETIKLGDGRENLKKALTAWCEFEDGLGEQYLERVKKSKRAPHVPAGGKTPGEAPDWSSMSRDQQDELMAEMARARMAS